MAKEDIKYIPTRSMLNIRILAGIYLIYLVVQLYKGMRDAAGPHSIWMIAAMAAFTVVGAALLFFSIRSLIIGRFAGGAMFPEEADVKKAADASKDDITDSLPKIEPEDNNKV